MYKLSSFYFVACAALISLLAGCASSPTQTANALRLYAFECGSIEVLDVSVFHPGIDKGKRKMLTNSCYLIVHPKGTLLWDAGLPDALVKTSDGILIYDTFRLRVSTPLGPHTVYVSPFTVIRSDLHPGTTALPQCSRCE